MCCCAGTLGMPHLPPDVVIVRAPVCLLAMWQEMIADRTRAWLTLHCHLPLTQSICLSTSHSGMFPKASSRNVLCLEWPLSVILLNSYSSFKSQLQVPLLCETMARLPLSSHKPLFPLAAACPCPAP